MSALLYWCLLSVQVGCVRGVSKPPKPLIPRDALAGVYTARDQQHCGQVGKLVRPPHMRDAARERITTANQLVYDRKPYRLRLEAGRNYHWCLCGRSKSQPLCDGTHKDVFLKITQRPVRFQVTETKEYWLCNCKQTKNRPFCDGTHKQKEIQDATSIRV